MSADKTPLETAVKAEARKLLGNAQFRRIASDIETLALIRGTYGNGGFESGQFDVAIAETDGATVGFMNSGDGYNGLRRDRIPDLVAQATSGKLITSDGQVNPDALGYVRKQYGLEGRPLSHQMAAGGFSGLGF